MGRAQQCRCAKPEDQYRHRQEGGSEQKAETGQHGQANSAFAGDFAKALEHLETR
jgi:hypothetical protein